MMDLLVVSPMRLRFHAPATQTQRRIVSVMNPSDHTIVYKVKSNTPKLYSVRPNYNKVAPFEIAEFTVTLNAHELKPQTEHKMIVQSVVVTKETEHVQNPADVFQCAPEHAIHNTRIEITFEALPSSDLLSLAQEAETQKIISSFNMCKSEAEFLKCFQHQFRPLCDSCMGKEPNALKQIGWRHSSKFFGIVCITVFIGLGYFVKKYIDDETLASVVF